MVRSWVAENGLTLHPDKTRVCNCRNRGFGFLGHRSGARHRYVRRKSLDELEDTIGTKTRRNRGHSLKVVVDDLDRTLRGWFACFEHAHPAVFKELDAMIRRRLRAYLRRQEKRPGLGICLDDHMRRPNAYFADRGLLALHTAWETARRSR
jgi:RNA-directed DNA polymerase